MSIKIPWVKPYFTGREDKLVVDALKSTWISGGPYVDKFESQLKSWLNANDAICVSNGTSAVQLALLGAEIGVGDEVIVPNFTFVAPGAMVAGMGAVPVFADVDPDTWCLCPKSVEKKITKKTKAIVAVHIYGVMADVFELRKIADKHGIFLIEDAAEAFASKLRGKYSGTVGHIGTYSFHATKTITTGEGGMVVAEDPSVAKKMRIIRDHGMTLGRRYWHEVIGYNFRMTNIHAAMGCSQFEEIENIIRERESLYNTYLDLLKPHTGFKLQKMTEGCQSVMWAFAVEIDPKQIKISRDDISKRLTELGIEVRPGFYPLSDLPPYKKYLSGTGDIATSINVSRQIVALPFFIGLTKDEIKYIVDKLLEVSTGSLKGEDKDVDGRPLEASV